jgi:hypothetical protein
LAAALTSFSVVLMPWIWMKYGVGTAGPWAAVLLTVVALAWLLPLAERRFMLDSMERASVQHGRWDVEAEAVLAAADRFEAAGGVLDGEQAARVGALRLAIPPGVVEPSGVR